MYASKILNI